MDELKTALTALASLLAGCPLPTTAKVEVPKKRKPQPKEGSKRLCLTLNGFLIDLLRKTGRPMKVEELNQHFRENIRKLRRSDGSNYKGDLYKILIGVLSNCTAFVETEQGWTINDANARNYEESTLKNINRRLGKFRVKAYDENKTARLFHDRVRSCKSRQLHDLLASCDSLLLNSSFCDSLEDVGPTILSLETAESALQTFGTERLVGMLFMHKLLQENSLTQGVQCTTDMAEIKRKVARLALELHEIEKWLNREDELLTSSFA